MTNTIVLERADQRLAQQARRQGIAAVVADGDLPDGNKLLLGQDVAMPWDMLAAGFHFLERWDAAAPLWRYGVLAKDIGTPAERGRTEAIVRDLRVPVYACELLFVSASPGARLLLDCWREERLQGSDVRLAFLRALYRVKPLFLALPRTWLRDGVVAAPPAQRHVTSQRQTPSAHHRPESTLVHVEIAPGRYVCCQPDEVERYRQQFERMRAKRRT